MTRQISSLTKKKIQDFKYLLAFVCACVCLAFENPEEACALLSDAALILHCRWLLYPRKHISGWHLRRHRNYLSEKHVSTRTTGGDESSLKKPQMSNEKPKQTRIKFIVSWCLRVLRRSNDVQRVHEHFVCWCAWRYLDYPIISLREREGSSFFLRFPDYVRGCKMK